ncbi:MAG: TIGR02253 family HAD-type hydrolase [Candidatus Bilamarchaeaceae archaeon]
MVKHIFFDIDDTLFPTTEFAELARKKAIRAMVEMGLEESQEKIYAILMKVIRERGPNYPNQFDEVCKKLKVKGPAKYIAAAVGAYHAAKTSIQPYPEVPRTLMKLREESYKLYIASNGTSVKQWDKLILLGIPLFFEDVFISESVGEEKSERFFRNAMRKIRARPGECVMVGDKPSADIIPAKKAGMKTIRVLMGKHKGEKGKADAEIRNFAELPKILGKL